MLFKRFKGLFFCFVSLCVMFFVIGLIIQNRIDSLAKDYQVAPDNAPHADAIVILGAYVFPSGKPSYLLKQRLDNGINLYLNGKANKILVTGDHGRNDYDEVNGMKNYLLEHGIPREDIFLDHAGFDTYDSMYRAKEIFGIEKAIISTQQFHCNRSIYIARKLGLDAYACPADYQSVYHSKRTETREQLAYVKAVIETEIIKRKPKYLGNKIPITGNGFVTEG